MNDPDGSEVGAGREDDDMAAALVDRLYRLDAEVEAGRAPDDATDAADDEALAGLRMVRGLVARVRDEAPEVEPPQAM
ncbi:MAG: hypothetical protein KC464_17295, partial [Myxococcales bacterium]|nr:hypothetical protein [Myxococcales bacterium]